MKKLFNNSTKGNDTQNKSSKSKRKFLKTFSFTSLALLMGAAGVFAFAPIGITPPPIANANDTQITASGLGLDPKKDPIVYTTESGLEIRMSNADKIKNTITTTTNKGLNYTQDLTSFYYFTMGTYSGTIYTVANGSNTSSYTLTKEPINWIILGLGNKTSYFLDTVASNLFSTWKSNFNDVEYSNSANGSYFFKETFESTTPAGSAINSVVPSKSYIMDKVKATVPVNPGNLNEIPDGCMLVLSEKILGNMYFNSTGSFYSQVYSSISQLHILHSGSYYYGNRYRYFGNSNTTSTDTTTQSWTTSGNAGGSLYNHLNSWFNKDISGTIISNSFGFTSAQADLVVPQQLYTHYSNGSTSYQENPTTDGNTYYSLFPLAYKGATSLKQNFCIEDYLKTNAQRTACFIGSSTNQSFLWWLRTGLPSSSRRIYTVLPSGEFYTSEVVSCGHGVRPAMVMKLK